MVRWGKQVTGGRGEIRFAFVVTLTRSVWNNPTSRSIIRSTNLSNPTFPTPSLPTLNLTFPNHRTQSRRKRVIRPPSSEFPSLGSSRFPPLLLCGDSFQKIFFDMVLRFDFDQGCTCTWFVRPDDFGWDGTFSFGWSGETFSGTVCCHEFTTERKFGVFGGNTMFGDARRFGFGGAFGWTTNFAGTFFG